MVEWKLCHVRKDLSVFIIYMEPTESLVDTVYSISYKNKQVTCLY